MRALLFALVASVGLGQQTEVYNPLADRMRTENNAYLILPPERMPFEFVTQVTGDCGALVVTSGDRPAGFYSEKIKINPNQVGKMTTTLYDLDSKRRFVLPPSDEIESRMMGKTYIAGRHRNLVLVVHDGQHFIWSPQQNTLQPLPELEAGFVLFNNLSPYLIITRDDGIHAYDLDGNEKWAIDISRSGDRKVYAAGVVGDQIEMMTVHALGADPKLSFRLLDPMTGQVGEPYAESKAPHASLYVRAQNTVARRQGQFDLYAVAAMVEQPKSSARARLPHELPNDGVVALEAMAGGAISRDDKAEAVWYIRNFELFVRKVVEIPLSVYEEQFITDYRNQAMMNAKNVAVGMHIYSADYDDQFPPLENMPDALKMYLKDSSALEGMVFLLDGGSMKDMGDPAATVMGYRDTSYGRVLMFADGHIQWRDP